MAAEKTANGEVKEKKKLGLTSIILIALGCISLAGVIAAAANGRSGNAGGGVAFIVLGAYLIHRAKRKKEEQEKRDEWGKQ